MKILSAASELYPFVKTGGLGDVAAALPPALAAAGLDVRLLVPGYPEILSEVRNLQPVTPLPDFFGAPDARLLKGVLPDGMIIYVIECDYFYNRAHPYLDANGVDWGDNYLRFGALSSVAADLGQLDPTWVPDIVHGHDWQCGLMPAYLYGRRTRPATVMTVHNLAYQGLFPAEVLPDLRLPPSRFSLYGAEFYGKVGFLKAGLYYADALTTVSPTYALETQSADQGCGLDGLLRGRARDYHGILNGVDINVWDPRHDKALAKNYDAQTLAAKTVNRRALLKECGLTIKDDAPVFAAISRLVSQKGLDLLLAAIPALLRQGAGLVVLGSGDAGLEGQFQALAASFSQQVSVKVDYDEKFAHRIVGGADAVVLPSRFEPCGLVQLYGLRYGTIPVVRRTGGLADSVVEAKEGSTGFVFDDISAVAFGNAMVRALDAFRKPAQWQAMQKRAMDQDFSWRPAAAAYKAIYQRLVNEAIGTLR